MEAVLAVFRSLVVLASVLAVPAFAILLAYQTESAPAPRLSPPSVLDATAGQSDRSLRASAARRPIAQVAAHPVSANPEEMRHLAEMRKQLESLGAEYVLLESSDGAGAGFRFYCRVPIRNTPYVKVFEVRHQQPLPAMRAGVDRVTRWIDGQRGAGMEIVGKP